MLSAVLSASQYDDGEVFYFQKGCTSCHGNEGQGLHEFPRLANQKAKDLRKKLNAYRDDLIKTPQASIMTGYAKNLSPKEMEAIIEYLSNFKKVESGQRYDDSYEAWGDGGS